MLFRSQLRAFARTVRKSPPAAAGPDGLDGLVADADAGIRALELLEAVRASLARNTSVALEGSEDG